MHGKRMALYNAIFSVFIGIPYQVCAYANDQHVCLLAYAETNFAGTRPGCPTKNCMTPKACDK